MQHKLSLLVLSSAFLCSDQISGKLFAQMRDDTPDSACCPKPLPCCPSKPDCIPPRCAQLVDGPKGEITPNAGPCVACGLDFYITADFIYWMAREDNLAISVVTSGSRNAIVTGAGGLAPFPPKPPIGEVEIPDFKWRPGFKVGLGWNFGDDGWDLFAQYTWLRSNDNKGSQHQPTVRTVLGALGISQGTSLVDAYWNNIDRIADFSVSGDSVFTDSSGKWTLHFNVIDLELGRNFYVSRRLVLRPFIGVKGTWDKQKLSLTYTDNNPSAVDPGTPFFFFENQTVDIWGAGLRGGLNTTWHWTRSFSFLGDIAVTALWEHFKTEALLSDQRTMSGTAPTAISEYTMFVERKAFTLKPVLEMLLGMRWETYTCDNAFHFAVDAGWEMQWWPDQNQFLKRTLIETAGGDLFMQGLTLKFRFDF